MTTQEWLLTKPKSFQIGYEAGCDNGKDMVDHSYVFKANNTKEYKTNGVYKNGWDEGYYDCYTDLEMSKMTNTRFGE